MIYLLDTNIILLNLRKEAIALRIREELKLDDPENTLCISVVTLGELRALSLRNDWGSHRQATLSQYLSKFTVLDINVQRVIDRYAQIDAFSQNKLKDRPLSSSARNMGKNDIWIAATASVLNATLVTTDADFGHLINEFLLR